MIPHDTHLNIGSLLFEGIDQIDLTGPFEVLSRIPNSTYRIYAKTMAPVRDVKGLWLTPNATLAEAPSLDVLHVPGGFGQEALMEDAEVLGWIRRQAGGACSIFSVCTGALLCGAAGLLKGRRATTHWSAFHLLPFFGAIPSTNVWWWTEPGSPPRVLPPVSTALCASRPNCAETRLRRPFSFTWSTRRSRPSTAARLRQHQPRSWRKPGGLCAASRRSASKMRGVSPPSWGSSFRRRAGNEPAIERFGENRGTIGTPATGLEVRVVCITTSLRPG
jgi:hypothetical protein